MASMLNICGHQGNVNQNHTGITSYPLEWLVTKTDDNKFWRGCRKLEPLHVAGEIENGAQLWRTICLFLGWLTVELPYHPAICTQERGNTRVPEACTPVFTTVHS